MAAVNVPVTLAPGARLCDSGALAEGGTGLRFLIQTPDGALPAFVVRHAGQAHAYLNRCAHRLVELDWEEGQFFDGEKRHLVCATHGALYDPATGLCIAGPCRGANLVTIAVHEAEGSVWLAAARGVMVK